MLYLVGRYIIKSSPILILFGLTIYFQNSINHHFVCYRGSQSRIWSLLLIYLSGEISLKLASTLNTTRWSFRWQNSHIYETLKLLTFAGSSTDTKKRQQPEPGSLLLITPPLCTAEWIAKPKKSIFFRRAILDYFWAKIVNSESTSLSQLLCKESFCNQLFWPRNFLNGSSKI